MNEDRQNQISELEAFQSFLREGKFKKLTDWNDVSKEIEGIIEVDFDGLAEKSCTIEVRNGDELANSHHLEVIPPCHLRFKLPFQYPSVSSPIVTVESEWMTISQKSFVETEVKQICDENLSLPVLYFCYQTIIDKISESYPKVININEAYILKDNPTTSAEVIFKRLIGESERVIEENFSNTLYDCQVCFESHMGDKCIRFAPCNHVFCKSCTFGYYQCTTSGTTIQELCCLADKCSSEAPQWVIREALNDELFAKYDEYMLQKAIHDIEGVVRCPRTNCEKIAYLTDSDKNLVECSYCEFSFCYLCKRAFHGVEKCKFSEGYRSGVLKRWNEGNKREKEIMSKEFGGENRMKELIEQFQNDEWVDQNSKPCPKCKVNIEKTEGCHKMYCTKCGTLFCWLCSKTLNKDDPYKHFRENSNCAGRLFEGVDFGVINDVEDDEDEDVDEIQLAAMFEREDDFVPEYEDDFVPEYEYDFNNAFDDGTDEEQDEEGDEIG